MTDLSPEYLAALREEARRVLSAGPGLSFPSLQRAIGGRQAVVWRAVAPLLESGEFLVSGDLITASGSGPTAGGRMLGRHSG